MRRPWVLSLCLFAVTLGVFWPVGQNDFIYYDDPQFITENAEVKAGLTAHGVAYAFTRPLVGNWHPVTTLSHMLDCQLFEVNPGAHHLVNAVIHAVNAALVFLLLFQMTTSPGRSLAVAALFALHPLRVESVAWVSERKDVLCAFFGLWCLLAYVAYANAKTGGRKSKVAYALAFLFLSLGLMSKAMLVTWPFVMLLLDFWPLKRMEPAHGLGSFPVIRRLALEKVPFLVVCLAFCIITLVVQHNAGAVSGTNKIALSDRIVNAAMSYVRYLGHAFWPARLAVIYPHPALAYAATERWPNWLVGLAALSLIGVTGVCLRLARPRPYLAVGWFWYLGTLVPVLGLVQVGEQALADRYTYLPSIGLTVMVVWAAAEATERFAFRRPLRWGLGAVVVALGAMMTRQQINCWRNTVTLFERTVQVTAANPLAHFALATGLERSGRLAAAESEYETAIAIYPGYQKAHYNLGQLLRKQRRWAEAAEQYQAALKADPGDVPSHLNLAGVFSAQGRTAAALFQYDEALRLDGTSVEALNNAAWILATSPAAEYRNGARAVQLAQRASELSSNSLPLVVGTLAAAYAEAGNFPEAIKTGEQARDLATAQGQVAVARKNDELLELYRAGKPYREPAP